MLPSQGGCFRVNLKITKACFSSGFSIFPWKTIMENARGLTDKKRYPSRSADMSMSHCTAENNNIGNIEAGAHI